MLKNASKMEGKYEHSCAFCVPRHHLNQLRFALENHDKSRSKCRLLPIYYFFEFRYDDKNRKAVPSRRFSSCLELLSVRLPFCPKRVYEIDEHLFWHADSLSPHRLKSGVFSGIAPISRYRNHIFCRALWSSVKSFFLWNVFTCQRTE